MRIGNCDIKAQFPLFKSRSKREREKEGFFSYVEPLKCVRNFSIFTSRTKKFGLVKLPRNGGLKQKSKAIFFVLFIEDSLSYFSCVHICIRDLHRAGPNKRNLPCAVTASDLYVGNKKEKKNSLINRYNSIVIHLYD